MLGRWVFLGVVALGLFVAVTQTPGSGAATGTVTQACSAAVPNTATVTFGWPAPQPGAQQTWLDISLVPGFAPGWFQGHGPLPGTQTAYALDGVPQGLTFYYRVNTLYPSGWRETASGSFVSNCAGGGVARPPVTGNVLQQCDGAGRVTVTFTWQANAPGSQWLDLSVFNNGFAPGSFVGAGPVPSGGGTFTWYGIARGTTHFWRVNALTPAGWSTSDTGAFTSLLCIPPIKACVGYMAGFSAAGRAECDQVIAGPDRVLADCVSYILGLPNVDGKRACVQVQGELYLRDCLLGLSGQSHFGGTSCRLYYESG